jgi:chromosome segregation ATPase
MMWVLIVAWLALLAAAAIAAQQLFGFNFDAAYRQFLALPMAQQVTIGIAGALLLFVALASIWQSAGTAQRNRVVRSLRSSLDGVRKKTAEIDDAQKGFDAAGESLASSEPIEAIEQIHKRLAVAEQRTAFQKSRNESVDLQERLEELRQRQQTLRKQLGEVADKRRTIEPVFGELKQRQTQLEEQLAAIETDDNRNSLWGRIKEVSTKVSQTQARLQALDESWEKLTRFKQELDGSKAQLGRLQAPETGLAALIDELHTRRDELARKLESLEAHGDGSVAARVDALSKSKVETEQRIARLDECYTVLNAIRTVFGELEERKAHLDRSLSEVEKDASGRSLDDRQTELNEFAAQARVRVRVLQDSAVALNGFRQDIDKSQAALVPLQAPADGIEAVIADLRQRRDRLVDTLSEIELHGNEKLSARVEALYRSKIETEQRIAQVVEQFARLDTIRNEIGGLFAKLNGTLDRLR